MADNASNGNNKFRRILAPHPWPVLPGCFDEEKFGRFFYLSWAGWELFMRRRLGLNLSLYNAEPIMLADVLNPEKDFLAIDQLAVTAAQLGTGLLNLNSGRPESLPVGLVERIRNYGPVMKDEVTRSPVLDDRSYLALWAISEFRHLESAQALAEAAASQRAMWAALKGEDDAVDAGLSEEEAYPQPEADGRSDYAWQCWQRLAEGWLKDSDEIIPTIALAE